MLHIINKSPFNSPALSQCLRFVAPQDIILFIEDGVYAAIENNGLPDAITAYALKEDVYARGLADKLLGSIKVIDYAGFVDLTLAHHPIQTWS